MEETPKGLTVIEGGKGNPAKGKKSGKAANSLNGLTAKQERFAQLLAEGLTNAEAYRQAYDCSNMATGTIHNESSKLSMHKGVSARVREILAQKGEKHSMGALKASERVWRNVWRLAEGENIPPSVQQAAVALAAKMAGLLTDKVEIENKSVDSKTLEAELLERLQRLSA